MRLHQCDNRGANIHVSYLPQDPKRTIYCSAQHVKFSCYPHAIVWSSWKNWLHGIMTDLDIYERICKKKKKVNLKTLNSASILHNNPFLKTESREISRSLCAGDKVVFKYWMPSAQAALDSAIKIIAWAQHFQEITVCEHSSLPCSAMQRRSHVWAWSRNIAGFSQTSLI